MLYQSVNDAAGGKLQRRKATKIALTGVCVALAAGDAPYCTPELYKECADPALGKKEASSMSGLNLYTTDTQTHIIP